MLNPVTLRAGARGMKMVTNTQSPWSVKRPGSALTFSASHPTPTESAVSSSTRSSLSDSAEPVRLKAVTAYPVGNTSVKSINPSLFKRLSSFASREQALKEAVHRPEAIKSGFLDRRSIQLPEDKQKLVISKKILRLLNDEEHTVQQDFQQLMSHLSDLPGSQAQTMTQKARDFFSNNFSRVLRNYFLQDLNSIQPRKFKCIQGLKAGIQSYQGNLEAVDDFLSTAIKGVSPQQARRSDAATLASLTLEKTQKDVHTYREALNHLVLDPKPLAL